MEISLGADNASTATDFQVITEVRKWFQLSGYAVPMNSTILDYLKRYRALKASGLSKIDIVIRWKKEGMAPSTAAAFVNAMEQIEKGVSIQDPKEAPSFKEIISDYKDGVTDMARAVIGESPWLKIGLTLGGFMLLYGAVTTFVKSKSL